VILNTSFNIHGEPIIENPKHALEHLKNKVVDKLVIGNNVYENK
jgi:predicted NodU family carbamoyl transferase